VPSLRFFTSCWRQVETFGVIRDVIPFRLMGASRDHIVVASDSGKVVILLFEKGAFERVHEETYGKTGLRRVVPGDWLAGDPRGRAFMLGAVEKSKLVYILNRDADKRLTISSPLEAHKSHTVCVAAAGLDVGYENPAFAVLEADYEGDRARVLTQYVLDMGLNHIVRRSSHPVNPLAHRLCPVPGGADGPSGVLVCAPGQLTWMSCPPDERTPVREVTVAFPARPGAPGDSMVVAWTAHRQKTKFFLLLQVEEGDVFKLTLQFEPNIGETPKKKKKKKKNCWFCFFFLVDRRSFFFFVGKVLRELRSFILTRWSLRLQCACCETAFCFVPDPTADFISLQQW
jgi:splicing factor 3B subunit 3